MAIFKITFVFDNMFAQLCTKGNCNTKQLTDQLKMSLIDILNFENMIEIHKFSLIDFFEFNKKKFIFSFNIILKLNVI